jgi:hypothetical protein
LAPTLRPSPAIVSQAAMRRLPRWALPLLAVLYILAGFVGRDPWKSADVASFGIMRELAAGRTEWLDPRLMGQVADLGGLLPYWLGALAIQWAPAWMPVELVVRIPFGLLLALTLIATWHGVYYLARLPAAQPVPFAFGGEANPVDYARAMADGGLLALVAMLGLAQLSHETTPTLAQLGFAALLFYAVAASPFKPLSAAIALPIASLGLALSGAPAFGLALALAGACVRALHADARAWAWAGAMALCGLVAAFAAWQLGQWRASVGQLPGSWLEWRSLAKLWLWFTWPAWPLALVALWKWRRWITSLHIAWPLAVLLVMVVATVIRPGADRTLLLAVPAFACLAAMALPTLHRSVSALIDWFTLLFFAGCSLVIWVVYVAVQTGIPAKPAANMRRLLPGFEATFSVWPLLLALAVMAAWVAIIIWRAGRHQAALWKSLVLPASGAVACWVLVTSLLMPMLDYARSYAPMVARVAAPMRGQSACVQVGTLSQAQTAALQFHAGLELRRMGSAGALACPWLLIASTSSEPPALGILRSQGWRVVSTSRRRANDSETFILLARRAKSP